jgi:hypothetical protein
MVGGGKAEKAAARKARLAAALRENLKRRKAQARARAEDRADDEDLPAQNQTASDQTEPDRSLPQAPDFRRNQGRD